MKIETIYLGGYACNSYILTDEKSGEVAVIDPAFFTPQMKAKIEPIKDKVKYILLTHRHFDHLLGVFGIKEMCKNAKVAIHTLDADGLRFKEKSLSTSFGVQLPHEQTELEPDILLSDGDEIALGELSLKVMHTPGHSAGSIMYIVDDVIFSGDTIFDGSIGRCDLETGSMHDMRMSLRKIRDMKGEYTVYPGHGNSMKMKN